MRPGKCKALDLSSELARDIHRVEQIKASIQAKVEHPFRAIKQQFGQAKVRYRGLTKNTARLTRLFAPSSLWMARRQPLGLQALPYRADQRCGPGCRPFLGEST